jgi:hypothetical protein
MNLEDGAAHEEKDDQKSGTRGKIPEDLTNKQTRILNFSPRVISSKNISTELSNIGLADSESDDDAVGTNVNNYTSNLLNDELTDFDRSIGYVDEAVGRHENSIERLHGNIERFASMIPKK